MQDQDALLDRLYTELNVQVRVTSCAIYDADRLVCQQCKFYQENTNCKYWYSVFGKELVAYVSKLTQQGIKIGSKFLDTWNARKALVIPAVPKSVAIKHSAGLANESGLVDIKTETHVIRVVSMKDLR